jgi:hypothetical protein
MSKRDRKTGDEGRSRVVRRKWGIRRVTKINNGFIQIAPGTIKLCHQFFLLESGKGCPIQSILLFETLARETRADVHSDDSSDDEKSEVTVNTDSEGRRAD